MRSESVGLPEEEELKLYKERNAKRRLLKRILIIGLAVLLLLILVLILFRYYFVVREIEITGTDRYSYEELLEKSGIGVKDNIFAVAEKEVEKTLKEAFPYVKSVTLEKDYPDRIMLSVTEEYTTYSYEMLGEYFLFNHELRLMEKFDSLEALQAVRKAIVVKMPLPDSCIVPQYIKLPNRCEYVSELIDTLSQTPLVSEVTELDLSDKYVIRLVLQEEVTVEFGDYTKAEEKFLALYRLLGNEGQKMTGHIDLSDYPNCFYTLKPKYDS